MSVRLTDQGLELEGECRVEDAEALAGQLDRRPDAVVGLAGCRSMHGAVLQALLHYRPVLDGLPDDAFLRAWVLPNTDLTVALSAPREIEDE